MEKTPETQEAKPKPKQRRNTEEFKPNVFRKALQESPNFIQECENYVMQYQLQQPESMFNYNLMATFAQEWSLYQNTKINFNNVFPRLDDYNDIEKIRSKFASLCLINIDSFDPTKIVSASKFFMIRSLTLDDIHKGMKYGIWTSTHHNNKLLDKMYKEVNKNGTTGKVYLFYRMPTMQTCLGVATMESEQDEDDEFGQWWNKHKTKGGFRIRWLYIKNVDLAPLDQKEEGKQIYTLPDCTEIAGENGMKQLNIFKQCDSSNNIFNLFQLLDVREDRLKDYRKNQEYAVKLRKVIPRPSLIKSDVNKRLSLQKGKPPKEATVERKKSLKRLSTCEKQEKQEKPKEKRLSKSITKNILANEKDTRRPSDWGDWAAEEGGDFPHNKNTKRMSKFAEGSRRSTTFSDNNRRLSKKGGESKEIVYVKKGEEEKENTEITQKERTSVRRLSKSKFTQGNDCYYVPKESENDKKVTQEKSKKRKHSKVQDRSKSRNNKRSSYQEHGSETQYVKRDSSVRKKSYESPQTKYSNKDEFVRKDEQDSEKQDTLVNKTAEQSDWKKRVNEANQYYTLNTKKSKKDKKKTELVYVAKDSPVDLEVEERNFKNRKTSSAKKRPSPKFDTVFVKKDREEEEYVKKVDKRCLGVVEKLDLDAEFNSGTRNKNGRGSKFYYEKKRQGLDLEFVAKPSYAAYS